MGDAAMKAAILAAIAEAHEHITEHQSIGPLAPVAAAPPLLPTTENMLVIICLALLGGITRISKGREWRDDKPAAWAMLFRSVSFAFAMSWGATTLLASYYPFIHIPQAVWYVSFFIAFVGDDWFRIHTIILEFISRRYGQGENK